MTNPSTKNENPSGVSQDVPSLTEAEEVFGTVTEDSSSDSEGVPSLSEPVFADSIPEIGVRLYPREGQTNKVTMTHTLVYSGFLVKEKKVILSRKELSEQDVPRVIGEQFSYRPSEKCADFLTVFAMAKTKIKPERTNTVQSNRVPTPGAQYTTTYDRLLWIVVCIAQIFKA